MELAEIPEHLLIVGGGYIGLEFAQMFRRFGSLVTVVQRNPQLLPNEDEDVAAGVQAILEEDGIEVLLETEPRCVASEGSGIQLAVRTPGGERMIRGLTCCSPPGARPIPTAWIAPPPVSRPDDKGSIKANERLETSAPGVYALGDVKGGPQFTHISYDDFRIIRTNLLEGAARPRPAAGPLHRLHRPAAGPRWSEREGRPQTGTQGAVARMQMSSIARALEMDESRGFMKAVVDVDTGKILGASVLGIEGGELMSVLQLAMMGGVTARRCGTPSSRTRCWPSRSTTCSLRSTHELPGDAMTTIQPAAPAAEAADEALRAALAAELAEARSRTLGLMATLSDEDLHLQHDPLMSPVLWDLGHIAAFEDLWLTRNLSGHIEFSEMPGLYNPFEHPRRVRGHWRFPA